MQLNEPNSKDKKKKWEACENSCVKAICASHWTSLKHYDFNVLCFPKLTFNWCNRKVFTLMSGDHKSGDHKFTSLSPINATGFCS